MRSLLGRIDSNNKFQIHFLPDDLERARPWQARTRKGIRLSGGGSVGEFELRSVQKIRNNVLGVDLHLLNHDPTSLANATLSACQRIANVFSPCPLRKRGLRDCGPSPRQNLPRNVRCAGSAAPRTSSRSIISTAEAFAHELRFSKRRSPFPIACPSFLYVGTHDGRSSRAQSAQPPQMGSPFSLARTSPICPAHGPRCVLNPVLPSACWVCPHKESRYSVFSTAPPLHCGVQRQPCALHGDSLIPRLENLTAPDAIICNVSQSGQKGKKRKRGTTTGNPLGNSVLTESDVTIQKR